MSKVLSRHVAKNIATLSAFTAVLLLALNPWNGAEAPPTATDGNPAREGHRPSLESSPVETDGIDNHGGNTIRVSDRKTEWLLTGNLVPWTERFDRETRADLFRGTTSTTLSGLAIKVLLRVGAAVSVLASGVTDQKGRVSIALPGLERLTSSERLAATVELALDDTVVDVLPMRPVDRAMMWHPDFVRLFHVELPYKVDSGSVELKLVLPVHAGGWVRGQVPATEGWLPPLRAHITVESEDGGRAPDVCSLPSGAFRIPIWSAGTFRLTALLPNGDTAMSGPIELRPGVDEDVGVLAQVPVKHMGGRLEYPDGAPVRGVPVFMYGPPNLNGGPMQWPPKADGCGNPDETGACSVSDADGSFRMAAVIPSRRDGWGLYLKLPGYALSSTTWLRDFADPIPTPREDLVIQFRAHRFTLRVQSRTGVPLRRVGVTLRIAKAAERKAILETFRTDARGRVEFWLPRGVTADLSVLQAGMAPMTLAISVPTTSNESRRSVTLEPIAHGAGFRIRYEDEAGVSRHPSDVFIDDETGERVWDGVVLNREFTIPLPPGSYQVGMRTEERIAESNLCPWMRADVQVEVGKGLAREVSVMARPASYVRISLHFDPPLAASSSPVRARVDLQSDDELSSDAWEHISGSKFPFPRSLAPGLWTIHLKAKGYGEYVRRVDLEPGAITRVRFDLTPE